MPPTPLMGLSVRARIEMLAEKTRPWRQAQLEQLPESTQQSRDIPPVLSAGSTETLDGVRRNSESQAQLEPCPFGHIQSLPDQPCQVIPIVQSNSTETSDGAK